MASYSNAQKLSAVLNHWASPLVSSLVSANIGSLPLIANIEAKIKSTGWVSSNWSISRELSPIIGNMSSVLIVPIITQYLSGIPDEAIPAIAHEVINKAIATGSEVSILEGKVNFSQADLEELKNLLDINLPLEPCHDYVVSTTKS